MMQTSNFEAKMQLGKTIYIRGKTMQSSSTLNEAAKVFEECKK